MFVLKSCLCLFVLVLIRNLQATTYYFSINKTTNEYMIRPRYNSTNAEVIYKPTLHLGELRNNVTRKKNMNETPKIHPLLDPLWNYNYKNITRPKLPTYIQKYYEMHLENLTAPVRFLFSANETRNSSVLKYSYKNLRVNQEISDMELHFYLKINESLSKKSIILRLYQIEHGNLTSLLNPDSYKLLNVIYIYQAQNGWQVFKLKQPLQSWFDTKNDLTIFITVSKPNEEKFTLIKNQNKDIFRPFLLLKFEANDEGSHFKNKIIYENSNCIRRNLHINFTNLNWLHFIIAPSGYDAFTCAGSCYKATSLPNHLRITNSVPEIAMRQLCCIPIQYHPLPIMFYDKDGNVAVNIYEDMVITKCGCR